MVFLLTPIVFLPLVLTVNTQVSLCRRVSWVKTADCVLVTQHGL